MNFVITGATGQLGRLVVEALLRRNVAADQIIATGRGTSRIIDLADRGVLVRRIDYDDPGSMRDLFAGASRVLLVSGSEFGRRVDQHRNVIDAAKNSGVGLLAYTSIANAGRSGIALAADHQATEKALDESGLPFTLLRNGWYLENYTAQVADYLEHGVVLGSAGDGKVSAATRADYAEAAAAVLVSGDHTGKIYEFGGDEAFGYADLAGAVAQAAGRPIRYRDLRFDEYVGALVGAGLPDAYAAALADSDLGIARGELLVSTGDLSRLIGRPTTSMPDAIGSAVRALRDDSSSEGGLRAS